MGEIGFERLFRGLDENPSGTIQQIRVYMQGQTVQRRMEIQGPLRREIVRALVKLATRRSCFEDSVVALGLLAEAENESWANNATGEFIARFQILLSGTSTPYPERLAVLDQLLKQDSPALNGIIVKALALVGEKHASRMMDDAPLPEPEWRPANRDEHVHCITLAVDRLTKLAAQSLANIKPSLVKAAEKLSNLLRIPDLRQAVSGFFLSMQRHYPDTRETLRRIVAALIVRERKYGKRLPEEDLADIETLHHHLEDSSLRGRLRQEVGTPPWETLEEDRNLAPIASKLLASKDTLREEWQWLTSGEAANAWSLGQALAKLDSDHTLATELPLLPGSGPDLRLLCGYIAACREANGDSWYEDWLGKQFERAPKPLGIIIETIARCGATESIAQPLAALLRSERLLPHVVGQLSFGRWHQPLSQSSLSKILEAMISTGNEETAVCILMDRLETAHEEINNWKTLGLELATAPKVIRTHGPAAHYWTEVGSRFAGQFPGDIAAAIFAVHADRREDFWFAEYDSPLQVLLACASANPQAVWGALVPYLESEDSAVPFSIGFPASVMKSLPAGPVLEWVGKEPASRAPTIARIADKDLSTDETLAARLLGDYGDDEEVRGRFLENFISGSWSGPVSQHREKLARELEAVAERTKMPNLRKWATWAADGLRQMAEQERRREEERDIHRNR